MKSRKKNIAKVNCKKRMRETSIGINVEGEYKVKTMKSRKKKQICSVSGKNA